MTNIFQMSWFNHQPDLNKFPTKWVFHSTSRTQNLPPAVSALSAGEDMEEKKPVRILEMLFLKVLYKDRDDRKADGCWWYQF